MTENTTDTAFDIIGNALPDAGNLIEVPLIVVRDQVILPHTITPIPIRQREEANKLAAYTAIKNQQTLIFCNQKYDSDNQTLLEQLHQTGTEIAIIDLTEDSHATTMLVMAQGRRRVQVVSVVQKTPFYIAKARIVKQSSPDVDLLFEYRDRVHKLFGEISDLNETIPEEVVDYIFDIDDDAELADMVASTLPLTHEERQQLLDEHQIDKRFEQLASLLERELQSLEVRDEVNAQVQDEIARVQREMVLREQMRVIQNELGEMDGYEVELGELRERITAAHLPYEANQQALKELNRLSTMPPMAPEASVIRTYLDWILDLPWHTTSKDNLKLRHAEKVLDTAHYGLDKVKERVLEHIAVRKMAKENMKTPIICFVGPPGVGKTSLGQSIAKALGREFVRVSLGGVRDEAEIRGHRRTYIGALPGRIIQTIKRAGTTNPVFMLDEIDKMSEDYRGDPSAALLEVLDPEQNHEFADHYLEVPYDLSSVLFIATANELYPLPEALEDRMEIIEFRAYTEEEKLEIAKRFLIPKQLKAHGISRRNIQFLDSAILHIIQHYTLEAGVRNLEREIANVCRKITRMAAMRKKYPKRVTANLVEKFLGPPYLLDTRLNREDNIGVATGLVWTSGGGDIQIIETALLPGKGNLTLTGQLGEVLQESAQIALNYMRSRADDLNVPHDDFENYDVHIHMPEGAVPKDGPSAGITLATAMISVFTEQKVRSDWAMTGEVTLRGYVLPVGGIKEKVLAARRRGIGNLVLPADNKKDLVDVPKKALRDLNIRFVTHMQEVMDSVLLTPPTERQRDLDEADEIGTDSKVEDNNE